MRRCTNLIRRSRRVEIERATVSSHARWRLEHYFEHCGKPAVRVHGATAWCKDCDKPPAKEDQP